MRAGVIAGVFFSMKYFVPVMLPFILGWLLALLVRPAGKWMIKKCAGREICIRQSLVETVFVVLVLMANISFADAHTISMVIGISF